MGTLTQRCCLLFLFLLATPALARKYEPDEVTCIYPLSGQYAPIARYLFYALLLFGIIARRSTWLIAGALATAMTYSGTAAIHALILAITSPKQPVLDIDLVGAWAVLTAGLFALWPVLQFSSTLRKSPFRPIFAAWALLNSVGAVTCMVLIYLDYPTEKACKSTNGQLLTQPYQVGYPEFDCTYKCFSSHRAMRGSSEIQVMYADWLWGHEGWKGLLQALAGFAANVGLMVTIIFVPWPKSWRIVRYFDKQYQEHYDLMEGKLNSPERKAGLTAEEIEKLEKKCKRDKRLSYLFFLNQVLSIIAVIFNEIYLLGTGLPVDEQPYGISQWGAATAVGLAILASLLNHYNDRKRGITEEHEKSSGSNSPRKNSFNSAEPSPFAKSFHESPYGKSFHEPSTYGRSFYDTQLHGPTFSRAGSINQQSKSRWTRFWLRINPWSRSFAPDLETGTQRPILKRHPTW